MNDTTIDWRDHLVGDDDGDSFFRAEIPALELDDHLGPVEGATIRVEAAAPAADSEDEDEAPGVTLCFYLPNHGYDDVWFEVNTAPELADDAHDYAAAIAEAATAPEATSTQLHAWSNAAMPDLVPVPVQVATNPAEYDGVYLDLNEQDRAAAALITRDDAAHLAQLIYAAIDYLIDHGAVPSEPQ